jgi:hypothetical protein
MDVAAPTSSSPFARRDRRDSISAEVESFVDRRPETSLFYIDFTSSTTISSNKPKYHVFVNKRNYLVPALSDIGRDAP